MPSTAITTRHSTGSVLVARASAAQTPATYRPWRGRTSLSREKDGPPGVAHGGGGGGGGPAAGGTSASGTPPGGGVQAGGISSVGGSVGVSVEAGPASGADEAEAGGTVFSAAGSDEAWPRASA